MKFTTEELLQEIAAGNRTIEGLAAKFGLRTSNMKSALAKLGLSLEERESEPIVMNDFPASVDNEWDQLYRDYDLEGVIGNQAQFVIADCRIRCGMTAAQTREYMRDNFHYQTIVMKFIK